MLQKRSLTGPGPPAVGWLLRPGQVTPNLLSASTGDVRRAAVLADWHRGAWAVREMGASQVAIPPSSGAHLASCSFGSIKVKAESRF